MFQSLFLAMSFFISTEALAHSSSSNYSQQALNSVKPYPLLGSEVFNTPTNSCTTPGCSTMPRPK